VVLIIPTLLIVSIIVFLTVRLIPGDIIDMMVGELGSEAGATIDREAVERALGLDQPVHVQYGRWVRDIVTHGSLGTSMRGGGPVTERILNRLPVTFELGLIAIVVGLLIAIPIGVYSAIRQDTWGDYVGRSLAIIFISVPSFWTGTMIMIYPSLWWGWSPPMKMVPFLDDPIANLQMFIIPSFILGMLLSGTTMRMARTMMLEVLRQDYIRTAWSKGLRERVVVLRHALRNALIPVVTMIGMQLPVLVGGSVILEQIFNLPGIGRLMLQALSERDYTIVSGVNLFIAAVVIGINLVIDLTYGYLDPRLHYR
jgi:peptide/nickel transport system permease protein